MRSRLLPVLAASACTIRDEDITADLAEARAFNAYPVSWAGYPGEGGDEAAALRLVGELRSLNRLGPRFGPNDPIPAPRPGVLEGTARFCP